MLTMLTRHPKKQRNLFNSIALIFITIGLLMKFFGSTFLTFTYCSLPVELKSNMFCQNIYKQTNVSGQTTQVYKMLWYSPPEWIKNRKTTRTKHCDYKNCEVTFNKSEMSDADIVLFHHKQMNIEPPDKSEGRKWVFASWETPITSNMDYKESRWRDKFDWTMTYRKDSEGFAPYGTIIPNKLIKKRNYSSIYSKKTKDVAWVVSNCRAPSKRDKYVAIMRKIINVDIFGDCGNPCPDNCFKYISENYKFYLSFENALCRDYVTEKLFRIFREDFDLIPVVRGAPNIKQLLPSKTYISTLDYSSPTQLAQHLKDLGSSETKYLDMLKSKHEYIYKIGSVPYGVCSLCEKLNRKFKRRKLNLIKAMSTSQCILPKQR